MSHHLFVLSPADAPLYSLIHQSARPVPTPSYPLASNLPSWSSSAFAGTFAALSGASTSSSSTNTGASAARLAATDKTVVQMMAHASLDVIEDILRRDSAMYLKAVEKINEWTVSAFITPGNMKFILLHESKNDDGIRTFFMDVWELYIKACLNPFHTAYTPIRSAVFDGRVRASAKRYL